MILRRNAGASAACTPAALILRHILPSLDIARAPIVGKGEVENHILRPVISENFDASCLRLMRTQSD
jgi:hypothetical protein